MAMTSGNADAMGGRKRDGTQSKTSVDVVTSKGSPIRADPKSSGP